MEIGLLLVVLGACCIRRARSREEDYPCEHAGEQAKPGVWQRLRSLWIPQEPAKPVGSEKPSKESRLQIRQNMDKKTRRVTTCISYRENGRSASVKVQENITLEFAGLVFKLDPTGVKAQEVQKKAGGELVSFPTIEHDGNGRRSHNSRPNQDRRGNTGNRSRREEVSEKNGETWAF